MPNILSPPRELLTNKVQTGIFHINYSESEFQMKEHLINSYDLFLNYAEKSTDETQKTNVSSGR